MAQLKHEELVKTEISLDIETFNKNIQQLHLDEEMLRAGIKAIEGVVFVL